MKLLIGIRMKSMIAGLKKSMAGKKKGTGALLAVCIIICLFSLESVLFGMWGMMAGFLETEFAWLYFALAGLLAFAFGIFGTVFTTQNQMYQAKDNELLLAMPIKPGHILGSRVVVLYLLTIVFVAAVMLPAGIVYSINVRHAALFWPVYLGSVVLIGLLTQAVTCLLGWILHFLLSGFRHKAIVATLFMTAVMILYFFGISQMEELLMMLVNNGGKIADGVQNFAWPFYALGKACLGDWGMLAVFAAICLVAFGIVTVVLNVTFTKAMLAGGSKTKRAAKQKRDTKVRTAEWSICRKECKRFFSSTTYLVNIGMGLFMIVAFIGAGILLRGGIAPMLEQALPGKAKGMIPVFLVGIMGLLSAMTPISAPSVSLEGKHIWILRSMPISGAQILKSKLRFHLVATVPLGAIGVAILGVLYGCTIIETICAVIGTILIFALTGVLGLVFNMCFPRLDWPNEAAPCKQSMAVFFAIFGMMIVSVVYIAFYILGINVLAFLNKNIVFALVNVLFAGITYLFYLLLVKWGGKKFEML